MDQRRASVHPGLASAPLRLIPPQPQPVLPEGHTWSLSHTVPKAADALSTPDPGLPVPSLRMSKYHPATHRPPRSADGLGVRQAPLDLAPAQPDPAEPLCPPQKGMSAVSRGLLLR